MPAAAPSSLCPSCLYLHGGPGLSAVVERSWFGDAPGIDWWDQPSALDGPGDPLDRLGRAAVARLLVLAEAHGGPISLISHSIGAVLAVLLLRQAASSIRSVTLVNPVFDLQLAFVSLARRVESGKVGATAARDALARMDTASHDFLAWAAALGDVPERFELYWAWQSRAVRDRYVREFPSGPPMDPSAFSALGRAIQDRRDELLGTAATVPVRALIGDQDPMLVEDPVGDVRARLPGAQVRTVTGGHMVIFEQPPSVWAAGAWER